MASINDSPVYNLKAVVQETGLSPDTLRVWERRYGIPQPGRTSGKHRLYSQRDIDVLKWLAARRKEGLSISRAVELWRRVSEQGLEPTHTESPMSMSLDDQENRLSVLRRNWVDLCMDFDERRAEQTLAQAFSLYPVEVVSTEVIQKGLWDMNDRWYRGEASVQQMYFISELAVRRLESLLSATPPATRPERLLLANPPQERHVLGMLLLALFWRRMGWDVLYLGANLPLRDLDKTLAEAQPSVVVLSAQQLHTAATLAATSQLIHGLGVTTAYGGRIFNLAPALREYVTGYFLGESIFESLTAIEELVRNPPALPGVKTIALEYRQALEHYSVRLPLIEAQLQEALGELHRVNEELFQASDHLTQNIAAALSFGDMSLLDQEISWLEGLFVYQKTSVSTLYRYLNVFYRTAKSILGQEGRPVVEWLARITGNPY